MSKQELTIPNKETVISDSTVTVKFTVDDLLFTALAVPLQVVAM